MRSMPELEVVEIPTDKLVEYENNAKLHPHEQIDQIAASIEEFGFNSPILAWHNDEGEPEIVAGHGRLMAARKLGLRELPVVFLNHLSEEQRRAYILVDNQLTMNSGFDYEILSTELSSIFDIDMAQFDFDIKLDDDVFDEGDGEVEEDEVSSLSETFIVPPFSVLNTRSGEWQERKRRWLELAGGLSETREETLSTGAEMLNTINGGTSNFDPVLAETMYKWFCPSRGKILDPFGGEQTKGVVAGECGYKYTAVEIRQEQVALNSEKTARYNGVRYVCGDSNDIESLIGEHDFDMCLTSPPYYDLEVYSADDMSALGSYEQFMSQYENIFRQVYNMLAEDSFAVVKVGEIRDKKTGEYRSFVPDTINAMRRVGFKYYNEIILVNAVGTLAMRVRRFMNMRKVGKTHQNVLVFYKGSIKNIPNRFEPLGYEEVDDSELELI